MFFGIFFLYFWISINMSLFFIKWFSYYNTVELKHTGQTIRIILGQIHRCWIKKNNVWIYRNLFELKKIININIATTLNKLLLSFNANCFDCIFYVYRKKLDPTLCTFRTGQFIRTSNYSMTIIIYHKVFYIVFWALTLGFIT